jgi:hypothetical protein
MKYPKVVSSATVQSANMVLTFLERRRLFDKEGKN